MPLLPATSPRPLPPGQTDRPDHHLEGQSRRRCQSWAAISKSAPGEQGGLHRYSELPRLFPTQPLQPAKRANLSVRDPESKPFCEGSKGRCASRGGCTGESLASSPQLMARRQPAGPWLTEAAACSAQCPTDFS